MKPLLKSSKLYIYNTTENQVHVQYVFPEQNEESLNCLKLKKGKKYFEIKLHCRKDKCVHENQMRTAVKHLLFWRNKSTVMYGYKYILKTNLYRELPGISSIPLFNETEMGNRTDSRELSV